MFDDSRQLAHQRGGTGRSTGAPGDQATTCVVCGSSVTQRLFRRVQAPEVPRASSGRYRITHSHRELTGAILRCHMCGTGQLPPQFAEASASRYSNAEDPHYLEEAGERSRNAHALLSFLPTGTRGTLLEVGSACGFLLDAARQRGFAVQGIEPSSWAAEQARQRFGLQVRRATIEEVQFSPSSFDVVVMADIIEHLPAPHLALTKIRDWLKENGVVLILTPDLGSFAARCLGAAWWGLLDDHYVYFTRNSLAQLLANAGFAVEGVRSFGRRFTLNHWISKLAQYNDRLYRFVSWGVRSCRIGRFALYLNLGDQMVCIARKR